MVTLSRCVLASSCVLLTATSLLAQSELDVPTARGAGAIGDGVADDTDAIQSAIDEARGGVRFEKGVYRVTRPIVIDLEQVGFSSVHSNGSATVVMAGPGPAFRIIGHHDGTASPTTVKPPVWDKERSPLIDGLEIVGRHPEADGIELTGTMQPVLSRLTIREARHGIRLVSRNRNVIVTACHLYDNSGVGVYLDAVNLHQIVIGDSHISYNDGGGVVIRGGNVRNVHIGNCDLEGNMPPADIPSKAANVLVDLTDRDDPETTNRYVDTVAEMSITGSTLQHTGKNPSSANIRLLGREDYPVNTVSISGNVMSDVGRSIDLDYVSGISITGNEFFTGKPTDVRIQHGRHLVLGNNQFDPRRYEGERAQEGGLELVDCHDVVVNGLQMSEVTIDAPAMLVRSSERILVTGCQLRNCTRGIRFEDCEDCLVTSNMASGTKKGPDFEAIDSTGISVSSNLFLSAGKTAGE